MQAFFQTHKCSDVCKALGLKEERTSPTLAVMQTDVRRGLRTDRQVPDLESEQVRFCRVPTWPGVIAT